MALFPKADHLEYIEMIALSFGLSMVMVHSLDSS